MKKSCIASRNQTTPLPMRNGILPLNQVFNVCIAYKCCILNNTIVSNTKSFAKTACVLNTYIVEMFQIARTSQVNFEAATGREGGGGAAGPCCQKFCTLVSPPHSNYTSPTTTKACINGLCITPTAREDNWINSHISLRYK